MTNSYCPCCNRKRAFGVEERRINTAYADESRNYITSCITCYKTTIEYYADLWESYYRDIM
jgi:hypothetical protein